MKIHANQKEKVTIIRKPVHHVVITDFSGSMYGVLRSMGSFIKDSIKNMSINDKVSLVYFSGKNQCDFIIRDFLISDNIDAEYLNKKIDSRFSSTIGLTGFVEPINIISNIKETTYDINVLFLTDGYDNQWDKQNILNSVASNTKHINAFNIIEFGDYCNHSLLTEMFKVANQNCIATLLYSKTFDKYKEIVTNSINSELKTIKKVELSIDTPYSFVFDREFSFDKQENGKFLVSEDVTNLTYFDGSYQTDNVSELYYLAYHLAIRKEKKEALKALSATKDIYVFDKYLNSVTIQEINNAVSLILDCAKNESYRYQDGIASVDIEIDENKYCLFDLLEDLSNSNSKISINYEHFSYNRIGIAKQQTSSILTDEDRKEITLLLESKHPDLNKIKQITDSKYELKFTSTDSGVVNVSNFVFSQTEGRANLSLNTRRKGTVDLTIIPKQLKTFNDIDKVETFVYRNYTFIKDGRLNIEKIYVSVSDENFKSKLINELSYLVTDTLIFNDEVFYGLNLTKIPVMNIAMLKNPNFSKTISDYWRLEELKAAKKVYDDYLKTNFEKLDESLKNVYGEEQTKWLSEIGIGYNGFAPKTVGSEAVDNYQANSFSIEFVVGAKGGKLTLPSVNAVKKQIESGKGLNFVQNMMKTYLDELGQTLTKVAVSDIEAVIGKQVSSILKEKRGLEVSIMKTIFPIVCGGIWFEDIAPDQKEFTFNTQFGEVKAIIEFEEKTYEI